MALSETELIKAIADEVVRQLLPKLAGVTVPFSEDDEEAEPLAERMAAKNDAIRDLNAWRLKNGSQCKR